MYPPPPFGERKLMISDRFRVSAGAAKKCFALAAFSAALALPAFGEIPKTFYYDGGVNRPTLIQYKYNWGHNIYEDQEMHFGSKSPQNDGTARVIFTKEHEGTVVIYRDVNPYDVIVESGNYVFEPLGWNRLGATDLLEAGHQLGKAELLFEKIDDSVIEKQVQKLLDTKKANEEANYKAKPIRETIAYEDFSKLDIRVGTILECTKVPKAGEAEIIAQIREDIRTALATGAAKESFDTAWETKGRATKWALYALGADVCLWAEDYEAAITYCDGILESNSPYAPAFLSTPTHSSCICHTASLKCRKSSLGRRCIRCRHLWRK